MKKHKFSHSHIEHHNDGSHTVHHVHESGPKHDVKHAVASLDHLHDSLQDHLGQPNPGEPEAAAGQHGIDPAIAGPAGISPSAGPAPAPVPGA